MVWFEVVATLLIAAAGMVAANPVPHEYGLSSMSVTVEDFDNYLRNLSTISDTLEGFYNHFPTGVYSEGIGGTHKQFYELVYYLPGYDNRDVSVWVNAPSVIVDAMINRKEGERSYYSIKTLPSYVDPDAMNEYEWDFDRGVLTVRFPLSKLALEGRLTKPTDVIKDLVRPATEETTSVTLQPTPVTEETRPVTLQPTVVTEQTTPATLQPTPVTEERRHRYVGQRSPYLI